jgi:hypothetical protein
MIYQIEFVEHQSGLEQTNDPVSAGPGTHRSVAGSGLGYEKAVMEIRTAEGLRPSIQSSRLAAASDLRIGCVGVQFDLARLASSMLVLRTTRLGSVMLLAARLHSPSLARGSKVEGGACVRGTCSLPVLTDPICTALNPSWARKSRCDDVLCHGAPSRLLSIHSSLPHGIPLDAYKEPRTSFLFPTSSSSNTLIFISAPLQNLNSSIQTHSTLLQYIPSDRHHVRHRQQGQGCPQLR